MRARRFLRRVRSRAADGSAAVAVTHGDTASALLSVLRGEVPGQRTWDPWANGQVITLPCQWQGDELQPVRE